MTCVVRFAGLTGMWYVVRGKVTNVVQYVCSCVIGCVDEVQHI